MLTGARVFVRACALELTQPTAMMFPGPTWRYRTASHGPDGALDPDPCIHMYDDGTDHDKAKEGMQQAGETDETDREKIGKIGAPHDQTGEQQAGHAQHKHPVNQLLPSIVAARLWHPVFTLAQYIAKPLEPGNIVTCDHVVTHHANCKHDKTH